MKKVLFSILFSTLLFSAQGGVLSSQKFDEAKVLFESKKYEEAYKLFNALFLEDLSNPNVNFFLGQSAFMLKKYDEAISAYDRVLIADENAHRAKLEIARCYLQMGSAEKAKEIFLEVRDKVPEDVKKNVDLYLAAIEEGRKKHLFNGAAIIGMNYDTNIYGVTVDNELSDKIAGLTLNNQAKSGWAHQEVVAANYAYAATDTLKYKLDTVLFNKNIFSYHDMDINLVQLTPAISVSYGKLVVDYALFTNKIWLSRESLMSNWGLNPKLKYTYSPEWIFDMAFKYQIQQNNPQNYQRDNNTYSFEAGVQHVYTKELTFGAKAKMDLVKEKELGEKNSAGVLIDTNEVGYNLYDLTLNAIYKYSSKVMITPKLKIFEKNYIDGSISPITKLELYKREDREYQAWITGTYVYSPSMIFTVEYVHSEHDSNYVDNMFNKDTFAANVIIPF